MPIALDPNQLAEYVLKSDRDKANSPAFLFRHLTRRQERELSTLLKEAVETTDTGRAEKLVDQCILLGLAGWRNMPFDYDPQKLDDLLTSAEKWELALNYLIEMQDAELKKKSGSQSPSNTDNSAGSATA